MVLSTFIQADTTSGTARVTFLVAWYDVGYTALAGQPGVLSVKKGWRKLKEINTVIYDPAKISIQPMEQRLRRAGTYIATVDDGT